MPREFEIKRPASRKWKAREREDSPLQVAQRGPRGFSGEGIVIGDYTAGEIINGGAVVMLIDELLYKYDPADISNYGKCIGVANHATLEGELCAVILEGECNQMGGLTAGESYYAAASGGLTLTPPVTNLQQVIGLAKDATTIIVHINEPVIIN